ncbi:MAG: acyl carrier protein [Haloplasmataceae bacterium]|jgi:acyl carrier protein|nr:acyl carrier protein [Haloplasmataceae bacterium]
MIFEKVVELIANELSVSKEEIKMETHLQNDLGADSLDAVELIMTVEEEFDLSIPDDLAQGLKTVGDIVRYLEANK